MLKKKTEYIKINHFCPNGTYSLVGTEECSSTWQVSNERIPICQSYARNTKTCMGSALNHEHTITRGRSGMYPNSNNTKPSAKV